jgi:glutamyl-Q tRNA(Asp) synthetase
MADDILPSAVVLRFAPSPNGALHLGHAYSALVNERLAAQTNGRLLLRIEDLDRTRCKPQFEAAIVVDLAWFGIRATQPAGLGLPLFLQPLGGRSRICGTPRP